MVRIPGSHAPNIRNRSSKQNIMLTKIKPAVRSMSNAALEEMARGKDEKVRSNGSYEAQRELNRRAKKRDKKNVLQS